MTDEIYNTVDLLYLKNTPKKKNGELFTAPAVFFQTCLPPHLFIATEYTNNKSLKSTSCTRKMHAALCLINWGFYLPSGYTNLCLNEDYISFTVLTDFWFLLISDFFTCFFSASFAMLVPSNISPASWCSVHWYWMAAICQGAQASPDGNNRRQKPRGSSGGLVFCLQPSCTVTVTASIKGYICIGNLLLLC